MKSGFNKFIASALSSVLVLQPALVGAQSAAFELRIPLKNLRVTGDSQPSGPSGELVVNTSSLSFPTTAVGERAELAVVVTNQGKTAATLNILSASDIFEAVHDCGTSLGPGASCTVTVRFVPNAGTSYAAKLTISPLAGAPLTVQLQGQGDGAVLELEPAPLEFDSVRVGLDKSLTLTVRNTGGRSAALTPATLSAGDDVLQFSAASSCPAELDAGQSCTYAIKFTPTTGDLANATLTLVANTGGGQTRTTAKLKGTGQAAQLASTPSRAQFGNVVVGAEKHLTLKLKNDGNFASTLTVGALSAPFSAQGCTQALGPKESCDLAITFSPTTAQAEAQTLTVTGTDNAMSLAVTGQGVPPSDGATMAPEALNFGAVKVGTVSQPKTVVFTNVGSSALDVVSAEVTEGFVLTAQCGASLQPSESCTLAVRAQSVVTGPTGGALVVTTNKGVYTANLQSSSTEATPRLDVSASKLTFESTVVQDTSAEQQVMVTNKSASALSAKVAVGSASFLATTNCPDTLAPNASCLVAVKFKPQKVGPLSDLVTLGDEQAATTVSLTGTAVASKLALSSSTLTFGFVPANTTSAAQVLRLLNKGDSSAAGLSVTTEGAFEATHNCPTTLVAQGSCDISVKAAPVAEGPFNGRLLVQAAGSTVPLSANLGGNTQRSLATWVDGGDFGTVSPNASTAQTTVVLRNDGNVPMSITGTTLNAPGVRLADNTCASIAPNATCTLRFTLTPSSVGALAWATQTQGADVNANFTVKASVQGAVLQWSPSMLDFGFVNLGQTKSLNATLSNTGNVTAPLSGLSGLPAPVTADWSACASVAASGTCTVRFTFAPTAQAELAAGPITVQSTADLKLTNALSLKGTGAMSRLELSTATLDLGDVLVGNTSAIQGVLVQNTGNVPLTDITASTTGDFRLATNCSGTLQPTESCTVNVSLQPAAEGSKQATLSVTSSAPTQTTSLSGFGTTPLTPYLATSTGQQPPSSAVLDFGSVAVNATGAANAYLLATGTTGQLGATARISGPNASEFVFTAVQKFKSGSAALQNCGASVTANNATLCTADVMTRDGGSGSAAQLAFVIEARPTGASGTRTATLTVTPDVGAPLSIALKAVAPSLSEVSLSTSALTFDPSDLGVHKLLTVRLTNSGSEALSFTAQPALSGASAFDFLNGGGTTCSTSLPPGQYCDTTIVFTPNQQGAVTGALTFATNAVSSPHIVTLTGTGMQGYGQLAAAAGSADNFGTVAVGDAATNTFTFRNTGNKAVSGVWASVQGDSALTLDVATNTCGTLSSPVSVAAGGSCSMNVSYAPQAPGPLAPSALTVTSTATNSPTNLALTGNAAGVMSLGLSLAGQTAVISSYDYGTVNVGSRGSKGFRITNTGTVPAKLNAPTVSGTGYSIPVSGGTTCASTLAVGAYCETTVEFAPAAAPVSNGTLTFKSTFGQPLAQASLTGSGTLLTALTFAGSPTDFGTVTVGNTKDLVLSFQNTGNTTLDSAVATPTGTRVSVVANTCGNVAAGANCSVTARFAPLASGTLSGANVKLTAASWPSLQTTVNLTGTAVGATGQLTANSSTDFGTVTAGMGSSARSFTFKNVGVAAATGTYATVTGAGLSLTSNTCGTAGSPQSIAVNATCSMTVTYAPAVAGSLSSASVTVTSSAANSPNSLAVTGTAAANGFLRAGNVYWAYSGSGVIDYAGAVSTCQGGSWGGVSGWRLTSKTDYDNLVAAGFGGQTSFTSRNWPAGSAYGTTARYWTTTQYQTTANVWNYSGTSNTFSNSATTAGYNANNTICVHD